jgi:hypothetical protein
VRDFLHQSILLMIEAERGRGGYAAHAFLGGFFVELAEGLFAKVGF